MIAAMLLVTSVIALGQFAVYYWRAMLAGVASQPLSERVRAAAGVTGLATGSRDFSAFLSLYDVTPGLRESGRTLRAVRIYYRAVATLGRLALLPRLASWTDRELALCSRYVAVRIDQRLERNLACAAEIRSC